MEDSSVSEWFGDFLHSFLHNPASIRFGGLRQSSCCYLFEGLLPPVRIAGGTPIDRQCSCVFHSVQAVDLKIQEPSRAQVVESFLMLSAISWVYVKFGWVPGLITRLFAGNATDCGAAWDQTSARLEFWGMDGGVQISSRIFQMTRWIYIWLYYRFMWIYDPMAFW